MIKLIYKDGDGNEHRVHVARMYNDERNPQFDYSAVIADYFDALNMYPDLEGKGANQEEALEDLINQIEENVKNQWKLEA
jgi:hypothetical protein